MNADTALSWVNGLGGLAGFTALAFTIRNTAMRKYIPDPAIRPMLEELIEDFDTIIALGGRKTAWFEESERRRRELALASLNGTVIDDELNNRIGTARAHYLDCFSNSSPSRPADQVGRQLEAASVGRREATAAIDRLNLLVRRYRHL